MASISDMYDRFKKALLNASSTNDNDPRGIAVPPQGNQDAGINIGAEAQKQANRDLPIAKMTGSQFINPKVISIDNVKKKPNPLLVGK